MHPILFSIGKINFYSYGFFASLAFIAGYIIIHLINKREGVSTDKLIDKVLLVFITGIVVSRITFFVIYYNQFDNWWQIFYIWQGGLVSFGGLIGGLITYFLLFRKNLAHNLDILALAFLLSDFFWRIGCTLTGDHPSVVTSSWLAINGQVPVPLLEGIICLFGFVLFYQIYSRIKLIASMIFLFTLTYYGLVRLIVDHWRVDSMVGKITSGQFTGLVIMIISILAICSMILYDRHRLQIHLSTKFVASKSHKLHK
ncbi:MAG: hypothetical protein ACD_58C00177G0003 [uncultured bacterium]|nr:MAG: hypothetical protein ACD_58C00177G0003 [uncultured bacterium]